MASNKLYVGNLNYQVTEEELREIFSAHGQVLSVNLIAGKGFGFVEMDTPASAQAAKEALNGTDLQGRTMNVDEARPPKKSFRPPPGRVAPIASVCPGPR